MKPSLAQMQALVDTALAEDAPWGDLTAQAMIDSCAVIDTRLIAREDGVLCGQDLFTISMQSTDPSVRITFHVQDGERFQAKDRLATIGGPARAVLQAERVALNLVQRLSGIATLTALYVAETAGTSCRITDTRKTTPGLRVFERYAVRCGGGFNHRFSLSDAVMVKDNHLALLLASGKNLTEALQAGFATLPHTTHREVEVDSPEYIEAILAAGVHTIMLDNFTTTSIREAVQQIRGRALVEASGGITLPRIREIAEAGVDLISVGALTHSVRALDLGLDIE